MSQKEGAYLGGIRTVEDLRIRCRIDEETGCWHWGLAIVQGAPKVHFVLDGVRHISKGRRAAVMIWTGKLIPKGHVAFGVRSCHSDDCVNPEHARSGTRASHGAYLRATGKARTPEKTAAIAATNKLKRKLTPEQVREIRLSDEPIATLAERYGVTHWPIFAIKSGRSYRDTLHQASVFTFRPTIKEAA